MAKKKKKPPANPLAQARGVATFDYNNLMLLVQAPVQAVAEFLAKDRGAQWRPDVTSQEIELGSQSFLVLRMRGQTWTLVFDQKMFAPGSLSERDAQALSETLGVKAIHYGVSDTANAVAYKVYERGEVWEELETDDSFWPTRFASPGRGAQLPEDHDLAGFIDALFRELDAYEPGFGFRQFAGYVMTKPGDRISLAGAAAYFERIDHVVTP